MAIVNARKVSTPARGSRAATASIRRSNGTRTPTALRASTHNPALWALRSPLALDDFNAGSLYGVPLLKWDRNLVMAPRIYDMNFTVQRQYKGWLFQLGYQGQRTHNRNCH